MKIFKKILLGLLALIVGLTLYLVLFFQLAPQLGGEASGERLNRIQQADNYKDGVFVNTIETQMEMTWETMKKTLSHYLFEDKTFKSPQVQIQTQPFDRTNHEAAETLNELTVTWFGHSSILITLDGLNILTDPILVGQRASMFSLMGPLRFDYSEHISLDQLPQIDAVIISHDHYDHLDYPTIRDLNGKVDKFFMPLGVGAHFAEWGIPEEDIIELEWWDEVEFGGLTMALTPMRHFSGRGLTDRFKTLWGSWVLIGETQRIFFSGDGGYFPGFKEIGDTYGPFDLTFMECGAYDEGWSDIHMFPEETAQAHLDVQGELLMPIHWGKFDLALHDWKDSVERLTAKAEEENIALFTPEVGQTITVQSNPATSYWWEAYE